MSIAKKTTPPPSKSPKRGNLKPTEITPLVMAARAAYNRQSECGLIDDGETFDSWRHRQCMDAVGRPGITACHHGDFRPLLAHFQTLSGDDSKAFGNLLKSGKPTDHAAPGDTHEARRILAHQIATAIAGHVNLVTASIDKQIELSRFNWEVENPGLNYPGPDPVWLADLQARKAAADARGKGPCNVGYVVYLVRQKTRRPDLTLGKDWQAGLVDRCTVNQLTQIRDTVINRIAAIEGTGSTATRNKSQRSPRAKQSREPHTLDPRPGLDLL
jgi:hypothetical protein